MEGSLPGPLIIGPFEKRNLYKGESLKGGIFKSQNRLIFRTKGHCLLSWTYLSFINHSKPNIPAIHH